MGEGSGWGGGVCWVGGGGAGKVWVCVSGVGGVGGGMVCVYGNPALSSSMALMRRENEGRMTIPWLLVVQGASTDTAPPKSEHKDGNSIILQEAHMLGRCEG
eukprot:TRINITY_DN1655_c0_g1_i5.p1 TRINITY_DN1655_c0_g1~~TRINITY_DN1655_c0_g1_i5.p1  ORF type:complete len:102 (+),score=19.57 TRINITY_DN1655_c0_g1_i5:2-307(+)